MQARAAAAAETRERILVAGRDAFMERWYDEVTLQDIAGDAGVSVQTLINHFGGKEPLFLALAERFSEEIEGRRAVPPGDRGAAVAAVVADYEITGDMTIRMLATEERVSALRPVMDMGRASHRDWVARTLGDGSLLPALIVATDVYTWKLLRRDQRLSITATTDSMRRLVDGVLSGKERS